MRRAAYIYALVIAGLVSLYCVAMIAFIFTSNFDTEQDFWRFLAFAIAVNIIWIPFVLAIIIGWSRDRRDIRHIKSRLDELAARAPTPHGEAPESDNSRIHPRS